MKKIKMLLVGLVAVCALSLGTAHAAKPTSLKGTGIVSDTNENGWFLWWGKTVE